METKIIKMPRPGDVSGSGKDKATVVAVAGAYVTVMFPDRCVRFGVSAKEFLEGHLESPGYVPGKHCGERWRANDGQMMTIIAWNGTRNVTVLFEDGTVLEGRHYGNIREGRIANPPHKHDADRIGETRRATNGMMMEIIDSRGAYNLTIRFEDGTVVSGKQYCHFKKGQIGHPTVKAPKTKSDGLVRQDRRVSRTGEEGVSNRGQKMTVIACRGNKDLDVMFEDGTVVEHRTWADFRNGSIRNPNRGKEAA